MSAFIHTDDDALKPTNSSLNNRSSLKFLCLWLLKTTLSKLEPLACKVNMLLKQCKFLPQLTFESFGELLTSFRMFHTRPKIGYSDYENKFLNVSSSLHATFMCFKRTAIIHVFLYLLFITSCSSHERRSSTQFILSYFLNMTSILYTFSTYFTTCT